MDNDWDIHEVLESHEEMINAHSYNFSNLEEVINNHSYHIDINTDRTTALHTMINDLEKHIVDLETQIKGLTHD